MYCIWSRKLDLVQLEKVEKTVRFRTVRFRTVRFRTVRFRTDRFRTVRFRTVRFELFPAGLMFNVLKKWKYNASSSNLKYLIVTQTNQKHIHTSVQQNHTFSHSSVQLRAFNCDGRDSTSVYSTISNGWPGRLVSSTPSRPGDAQAWGKIQNKYLEGLILKIEKKVMCSGLVIAGCLLYNI